jgi:hypothetical protein
MRGRLYHVTVTLPCRDEYPGARGEKRTYTPHGPRQLARRTLWLAERYPGCPVKVTIPGPADRSPIVS